MNKWFLLLFLILHHTTIHPQVSDFKTFNFKKADTIAYAQKGRNLKNLPDLACDLTANLPTDVEKFRAIYTWVCTNIEGDYPASAKNKNKRKKLNKDSIQLNNWNNSFKSKVFEKLLNEQKTVCTGYAYLVKTLCDLADIECEIVNGFGRSTSIEIDKNRLPNHSWNAVKLNKKWYLCDATWSSGSFNIDESKFIYDYNDGYFLANPVLFAKDHFPIDSNWLLTTETSNLNTFWEQPFVYSNTYKYGIIPIVPSKMNLEVDRNKEMKFVLKTLKSTNTNQLNIELVSGTNSKTVKPNSISSKENLLEIFYTFENKGTYDVHLKINTDVVVTYVVSVTNKKE